MNILQKTFEQTRKDFFPRWDKDNEWRIELNLNFLWKGRCENKRKTIVINPLRCDKGEIQILLIHEIAHAVTSDKHGKQWQNRYLKAAKQAEEMGRNSLAKAIRDEVKMYQNMSPPPNAKMIYERIQEIVLETEVETEGIWPYEKIIKNISWEIGLDPEEMEKRFKKCRKVYDSAVEDY